MKEISNKKKTIGELSGEIEEIKKTFEKLVEENRKESEKKPSADDNSKKEPEKKPSAEGKKIEMNFFVKTIKYLTYFIFCRKFVEAIDKFYDAVDTWVEKNAEKIKRDEEVVGFTEDDMSLLKRDIRLIIKKIEDLEKERIQSDDNVGVSNEKISDLKTQKKAKEKELEGYQDKFKNRISSLDLESLDDQIFKYGHQLKALDMVLPAWVALFLSMGACVVGVYFSASSLILYSEAVSQWFWCSANLVFCLILYLSVMANILFKAYKEVPHKKEWVMEWQGEFLCSLDPGYHFIFPFFCDLREEVSMVVIPVALFPVKEAGEDKKDGKETDKVDFADDSASVVAEVFLQIFSSYKAVYVVDDCLESTRKKMEAGLRAYFGQKELDEAIATRADIDLRQIIIQPACQANNFKAWGVRIDDLAVRKIILPKETEELRQTSLKAKKDLDVAKIKAKTAKLDAMTREIELRGSGAGLAALAKEAGVDPREAIQFVVAESKWRAGEKAQSLILSDSSDGSASSSALTGAAAAAGINSMNKPKNERDEDQEKESQPKNEPGKKDSNSKSKKT